MLSRLCLLLSCALALSGCGSVLTATTCVFALGVGSVEATKHLIRAQAGALAGIAALPGLRTLRPRLAELAESADPLALQAQLATAARSPHPYRWAPFVYVASPSAEPIGADP